MSFAPYHCGISITSVSGDHNSHKFNRLLRAGSVKTTPILVEVCSIVQPVLKTSIDGNLTAFLSNSICHFTVRNVSQMSNWNLINLNPLIPDFFQHLLYSTKILLHISSVFSLHHNSVFPKNGPAHISIERISTVKGNNKQGKKIDTTEIF